MITFDCDNLHRKKRRRRGVSSTSSSRFLPWHLGQLEACITGDGIAEFVPKRVLALVVRQFEEIETRRRRRQSVDGMLFTDTEKRPHERRQRIASVLVVGHFDATDRERRLEVGKSEQRRLRARGDELQEQPTLLRREVRSKDVPQPADHSVVVVEAAKVFRVRAKVLEEKQNSWQV